MVYLVCWNSFNFAKRDVDGGGVSFRNRIHIKHTGLYLHCIYNWLFSMHVTLLSLFWFDINGLLWFFMSKILVLYFSLKIFLCYAARKGYSALPLTFRSCLGDRGFVDICCMPCCYYKSEATFQASAHSELSCTGKRTMVNINGRNLKM